MFFWMPFFRFLAEIDPKWCPKRSPELGGDAPKTPPERSLDASGWPPRFFIDFVSILVPILMEFLWFWMPFSTPFMLVRRFQNT